MFAEGADVVGNALVSVVSERVGWGVGAAVAHAVWCDDVESQGGEEGDLIAPAEGDVGKAVDEDDGAVVGS